jgi:hypothetical protein
MLTQKAAMQKLTWLKEIKIKNIGTGVYVAGMRA